MIAWIFAATTGVFAAFAEHYYFKCRKLLEQQLWLRQALRERDAVEREPSRLAFEAGMRVGVRVAMENDGEQATGGEIACPCAECRRERFAVN